ncbi:hypothetical protein [Massilia sp. S19_KUP03_FR1]|uniref:hypothetical protein n=1 Tax=Massilia sp. S19_KUP03_FR1 TaxID=3025503 RepID=UPI002FCDC9C0
MSRQFVDTRKAVSLPHVNPRCIFLPNIWDGLLGSNDKTEYDYRWHVSCVTDKGNGKVQSFHISFYYQENDKQGMITWKYNSTDDIYHPVAEVHGNRDNVTWIAAASRTYEGWMYKQANKMAKKAWKHFGGKEIKDAQATISAAQIVQQAAVISAVVASAVTTTPAAAAAQGAAGASTPK